MCEICRKHPCHPRCPNTESLQIKKVCSICNEGIYDGEEYIVNGDYEYAHWECVNYARDLAKFLGYEIKVMSKDY